MEFSNVTTLDMTRKLLIEKFCDFSRNTEMIKVSESINRTIAKDYFSEEDLPTFNRSTVDGYAVISGDTLRTTKESPKILNIAGTVKMGKTFDQQLKSMNSAYVPTGGMIPFGADGVVMIEDTELTPNNQVKIYKTVSQNENIIFVGDDLRKNEKVIEKGKKVSPLDIGILSVAGITEILVYKPLSFSLISTGDEIIETSEKQERCQIRDINSPILEALLQESGCNVIKKIIVDDDFEKIKDTVAKSLEISDGVIITGGSSVGKLDYTYDVLDSLPKSEIFIHGIKIKPGKPTIIAKVDKKPIFALPGHPVSAVIIFKLILEYFLDITTCSNICENRFITAKISKDIQSVPGKMTCQVVHLDFSGKEIMAQPIYGKSGVISLLSKAHGYVKIPIDEKIKKDQIVVVYLL